MQCSDFHLVYFLGVFVVKLGELGATFIFDHMFIMSGKSKILPKVRYLQSW